MQRCILEVIGPHVSSVSASVMLAVSGWFSVKVECHTPWCDLSSAITLFPFQSMQTSTVCAGFACKWCLGYFALSCFTGRILLSGDVVARNLSRRANHTSWGVAEGEVTSIRKNIGVSWKLCWFLAVLCQYWKQRKWVTIHIRVRAWFIALVIEWKTIHYSDWLCSLVDYMINNAHTAYL